MKLQEVRVTYNVCEELREISGKLHRLDEAGCNFALSKRQVTRKKNLMIKAEELAQMLGLHAYHQSDPRGWPLYLTENKVGQDVNYNNGVGICPNRR